MLTEKGKAMYVRALCLAVFVVGALGSALCVPYAICSNWYLVGIAGIYFIAGAIMMTGGLIAFVIFSNKIN